MDLEKSDFGIFLASINKCYSKECADSLPKIEAFPDVIFNSNKKLEIPYLLRFIESQTDKYLLSVSKRMIVILNIFAARESNISLDLSYNFNLISESISLVPIEDTISSIGSQGFLSIPLYKNDNELKSFDFIRLHIWDNSLLKYIDIDTCERFSIHTHSFFAKSWVLVGKVLNDRFKITASDTQTVNSLFTVGYNKSLNEVNQHTSSANNSGSLVSVNQTSHEVHMHGSSYQINAGDYHKSGSLSDNGLSATFFSFTAKDGLVDKSCVVGPSDIDNSVINRKVHINPIQLLSKIEKELKSYE